MNTRCVTILLLVCASISFSQVPEDSRVEREVRDAIDRYFAARQAGNREAMSVLTRSGGARFSAGGTRLPNLFGRVGSDKRKVAFFVRHIEFLRPDVALAVGLWRDADAAARYASGAFSYTLVKDDDTWKLATVQETLNQQLPALPTKIPVEPMKLEADWEILFDGQNAAHWLTLDGEGDLGKSWRVSDGCLISVPGTAGADLRSDREYRSFELEWEWMAAKGSNSGVKYRLFGSDPITFGATRFATGWEYQMVDDAGDSGARVDDKQKSGALYGVVAVSKPAARPAGEWNNSRLIVADDHVEHWLNGVMTARYPVDVPFESPVLLQHHASEVRFRNIRLRKIAPK